MRIALYSHDTMGLGHTRRNGLIAEALAGSVLEPDILLITGTRESAKFRLPSGVDCVTLPALHKDSRGEYRAKGLRLARDEIRNLRGNMIRAALESFKPDLLLVDKVPLGALNELTEALEHLPPHTRCVLGVRDILDDRATVQREWCHPQNVAAIERYYDALWVYGDPRVYDVAEDCDLPASIRRKITYVGYLDPRRRKVTAQALPELPAPFSLCLVGGGQDGQRLATAFAEARFPEGEHGVLVTGPYMPAPVVARLHERAQARDDLTVLEFLPEPTALLPQARQVVAMGGYNTVMELLAYSVPALIVPRVQPRVEQLMRAERLQALGLMSMLHPDDLTPEALSRWLQQPKTAPDVHSRMDMGGLERLPDLVADLTARALKSSLYQELPHYANASD